MSDQLLPPGWTNQQLEELKQAYDDATSFVEIGRLLGKEADEIRRISQLLGLRQTFLEGDESEAQSREAIRVLLQEHKRYLPNDWLVGLEMSPRMIRSLAGQIQGLSTFVDEIEEEIESLLDGIVELYTFSPLLSVGDILRGADHGQAYRIVGREFIPADKWVIYHFVYRYGIDDIGEDYDDSWDEEIPDDDDESEEDDNEDNEGDDSADVASVNKQR